MGNLSPGRQHQLDCAEKEIRNGKIWADAGATHMRAMHKGLSSSELLGRIYDLGLNSASTFMTENDMQTCVEYCLLDNLRAIYESVLPYATHDGERFPIMLSFPDAEWPPEELDFNTRHVGVVRGRDGLLREMTTDCVTVICKRDDRKERGFSLVTAYADFKCGDVRETGRSLVPALNGYIERRYHSESKAVKRTRFLELVDELGQGRLDAPDPLPARKLDRSVSAPAGNAVVSKADDMLARAKAEFAPKSVPVKQASPPGGEARRKYHESA